MSSLEEKLAQLSQDYLHNLAGRMDDLNGHWRCLTEAHRKDALRDAMIVVHSLAGSARTFGFPKVSETARALEMALRELEEEGLILPLPTHQLDTLNALRMELVSAVEEARAGGAGN